MKPWRVVQGPTDNPAAAPITYALIHRCGFVVGGDGASDPVPVIDRHEAGCAA